MNAWPNHAHTAADREHAGREGVALTEAARAGRRATLDPGAFVKRRKVDGEYERLDQWQERALVEAVTRLAAQPVPAPSRTEAEATALAAAGWDEGYRSGFSNAMRRMSDEPDAPTTPNPYRDAQPTEDGTP